MNATAGFLQDLCNRYGDFKVAHNFKDAAGDLQFTKHRSVFESWHSDWGLKFLSQATHRNILPIEIVLDIDENPSPERLKEVCKIAASYGFRFKAYSTGSRGYHVHIFDSNLASRTKTEREKLREFLITKTSCDLMKKSEGMMIAIENIPHWKSGKVKAEVMI